MINGLAKFVAICVAPLLSLTALVLSLLVFFAPSVVLHTQVALLTVKPSTALRSMASNDNGVDGPFVWMGAIGSCARSNKEASVTCTATSITPSYDLSVLNGKSSNLLRAPNSATPAFIALSLGLTVLFFILFTLISLKHKLGKFGGRLDRPLIQRISAWIGVFGFMLGLSAFLVLRLWFGKAIDDFNTASMLNNEDLLAESGNGFIMIWVAYAFYSVPLVCALAKLHQTTTASKGAA